MKKNQFLKLLGICAVFLASCQKNLPNNSQVSRRQSVIASVDLKENDSSLISGSKKQATSVSDDQDDPEGMTSEDGWGFPVKLTCAGDASVTHDPITHEIIVISYFNAWVVTPTAYGSLYGQPAQRSCAIFPSQTYGTINTPLPALAANCTWYVLINCSYSTSQGIFIRQYPRNFSGYLY